VFIECQVARNRSSDLGNLQTMSETCAKQIPLMIDKYLGFVFEPPECLRVNDSVPVSLKFTASGRRRFVNSTPARIPIGYGVACQFNYSHEESETGGTTSCWSVNFICE